MQSKIRQRLAVSPIARGAAFPLRTMMVARYDARVIGRSVDWLVRGRETTNLTYDLDSLNRDQLGWFISAATGAQIGQVRAWMQELEDDKELARQLTRRLSSNPRRRICAKEPHWARRLGWYSLVRAVEPDHVVETGTHLGLGSCVIAAALRRNGQGHLTTIDIDPEAGYLIEEPWASVIDRRTGSSIDVLAELKDVDVFLHDSLHTYDYETEELTAVEPNLAQDAIVLSDNAHESSALSDWAERNGRQYLFFKEQPRDHWWPGDGIGAAWTSRRQGQPQLSEHRMKRLAFVAIGAAAAGLTACTSSTPSAGPASPPAATSSAVANGSPALISAECKQKYDAWKQGPGKGLVAALDAVGSAGQAGDLHMLTAVLKRTKPALTRAARYPLPACADPNGYWTVLLMHINAAAASKGSAATLTAAMKGVPTLMHELNAELKHAGW